MAGGTDDDLLALLVAVVRGSNAGRKPRVGLVEASWHVEAPAPEARRVEAERWTRAGANVLDVGLVELRPIRVAPDVVVFPHWFASREARFRQTVRAFPGCRGLAVAHGGAVAVRTGGQIDVLRQGMAGATHATIRDAEANLDPVPIPNVRKA